MVEYNQRTIERQPVLPTCRFGADQQPQLLLSQDKEMGNNSYIVKTLSTLGLYIAGTKTLNEMLAIAGWGRGLVQEMKKNVGHVTVAGVDCVLIVATFGVGREVSRESLDARLRNDPTRVISVDFNTNVHAAVRYKLFVEGSQSSPDIKVFACGKVLINTNKYELLAAAFEHVTETIAHL